MNYAIDYGIRESSEVLVWENTDEPKRFLLSGDNQEDAKSKVFSKPKKPKEGQRIAKKDFLEGLSPEDTVWLELGGASDRFSLAAFNRGAKIFRCPTHHIKDVKHKQKEEVDNELRDKEDGTAKILMDFAKNSPEKFYPMRETDQRVLEIRRLVKSYWMIQRKMRVPAQHRFRIIGQDLELVGGDPLAEKFKKTLERVSIPEHFKYVEGSLKRDLERKLKEFPLYQMIFEPIRGCGPVTAGLVIGNILDIRRFPELANLRAYAIHHLVKDKEGEWRFPKRKKGQSLKGNPNLRQAIYYFVEEMEKQPKDHTWKMLLNQRKEYETEKNPDFPKRIIQARAKHWLGQKFIQYVWVMWRRFEGIGEEAVIETA
jgi:hypothetical protein